MRCHFLVMVTVSMSPPNFNLTCTEHRCNNASECRSVGGVSRRPTNERTMSPPNNRLGRRSMGRTVNTGVARSMLAGRHGPLPVTGDGTHLTGPRPPLCEPVVLTGRPRSTYTPFSGQIYTISTHFRNSAADSGNTAKSIHW